MWNGKISRNQLLPNSEIETEVKRLRKVGWGDMMRNETHAANKASEISRDSVHLP